MSRQLKLTVGLALVLSLALLVFGTAVPRSDVVAKSPYVSALSHYSVGSAAAARCTKTSCLVLQGLHFCRSEGVNESCVIVSGSCSVTACGH
jgi:hypothetical protein